VKTAVPAAINIKDLMRISARTGMPASQDFSSIREWMML